MGGGGESVGGTVSLSGSVDDCLGAGCGGRGVGLLGRTNHQPHCPTWVETGSWRRCKPREPWRRGEWFCEGQNGRRHS